MVSKENMNIKLQPLNIGMLILAVTLSLLLIFALEQTSLSYQNMQDAMDKYLICQNSADSMQDGSDYLTLQVRNFAVSGDLESVNNYFNEAKVTRSRDKALEQMEEYFGETEAYKALENALKRSNELMTTEYLAMKLVSEAKGYDAPALPEEINTVDLTPDQLALSPEEKIELARDEVFGAEYQKMKTEIEGDVTACLESMLGKMSVENSQYAERLSKAIHRQYVLVILLMVIVLIIVFLISILIIRPLRRSVSYIRDNQKIPEIGAYEMQYLARTYNHIFEKTKTYQDQLSYEANHDALTGLLNRGAFDEIRGGIGDEDAALILIDLDFFKHLNDNYGHETGDKALKRLAKALKNAFRSEDYVCRVGGDEFAVIMVNADESIKELIASKIGRIAGSVKEERNGVPGFTLSVGISFTSDAEDGDQLFNNADKALYKVKNSGRDGFAFFSKDMKEEE